MTPLPVWRDLEPNHGVLEIDESITDPAPALELHVAHDAATGATAAWWQDDCGHWLGIAAVGRA